MKTCAKCSFEYEAGKGCPECGRVRAREYQRAKRKVNPESCREELRVYRRNNPERVRKWSRKNYDTHSEERKAYNRTPARMAYQREWKRTQRKENPESVKKWDRVKYAKAKPKYAAAARARRAAALAANAERVRAKERARSKKRAPSVAAKRKANLERTRENERARYAANAEAICARKAAWRKANPEVMKLHKQRRRARLLDARSPGVTADQWRVICERCQNVEDETTCVYCDKACAVTIDHVVPIFRGGLDESDNVLPACKSCNSSKGAKLISEWRKAQTLLAPALYELLVAHTESYLKKAA